MTASYTTNKVSNLKLIGNVLFKKELIISVHITENRRILIFEGAVKRTRQVQKLAIDKKVKFFAILP